MIGMAARRSGLPDLRADRIRRRIERADCYGQ
jgi:hypothetical protein